MASARDLCIADTAKVSVLFCSRASAALLALKAGSFRPLGGQYSRLRLWGAHRTVLPVSMTSPIAEPLSLRLRFAARFCTLRCRNSIENPEWSSSQDAARKLKRQVARQPSACAGPGAPGPNTHAGNVPCARSRSTNIGRRRRTAEDWAPLRVNARNASGLRFSTPGKSLACLQSSKHIVLHTRHGKALFVEESTTPPDPAISGRFFA